MDKYHNNSSLDLVVNFIINSSDFFFMVLLMCTHTKHAQTQKATIDKNAKHAKNPWNQFHKPQQTYKDLRNENIF
jgi:hypothetical protein